jgi:hypothetical protein
VGLVVAYEIEDPSEFSAASHRTRYIYRKFLIGGISNVKIVWHSNGPEHEEEYTHHEGNEHLEDFFKWLAD